MHDRLSSESFFGRVASDPGFFASSLTLHRLMLSDVLTDTGEASNKISLFLPKRAQLEAPVPGPHQNLQYACLHGSPTVLDNGPKDREMNADLPRAPHRLTRALAKKPAERAVLVTTAHRGVFFGYATETSGTTIKLRSARNCIYWPAENKGFLGLAANGPMCGSKVGPAADIELRDITCVAECSPEATKAWEAAPWLR